MVTKKQRKGISMTGVIFTLLPLEGLSLAHEIVLHTFVVGLPSANSLGYILINAFPRV